MTAILVGLNLFGLIASLLVSFIAAGMETALYRASRVRLRIRAERGEGRATLLLRVLDRLDAMVTTILIDSNIATYAGTFFLASQLAAWNVAYRELVTTAVVTPLFFILTESLPKQVAYNKPDAFGMAMVRFFTVSQTVLTPIVWLLNRASTVLQKLLGTGGETNPGQSQRTLLTEHLNAGVAEKVLSEAQNKMALRIMQLEGISAGDSMVPLRRLFLLSETATRGRAVREMTRRRVQLALLIDGAGRPTGSVTTLTELLMHPNVQGKLVSETSERLERIRSSEAIPEVLNLFRQRHARMALVTKGNRIEGLITTQSVLDRIAGISAY